HCRQNRKNRRLRPVSIKWFSPCTRFCGKAKARVVAHRESTSRASQYSRVTDSSYFVLSGKSLKDVALNVLSTTSPVTSAFLMTEQKPSAECASPCLCISVPSTKKGLPSMRTANVQPPPFMPKLHCPQDASTTCGFCCSWADTAALKTSAKTKNNFLMTKDLRLLIWLSILQFRSLLRLACSTR